jgi:hypothetical protein
MDERSEGITVQELILMLSALPESSRSKKVWCTGDNADCLTICGLLEEYDDVVLLDGHL